MISIYSAAFFDFSWHRPLVALVVYEGHAYCVQRQSIGALDRTEKFIAGELTNAEWDCYTDDSLILYSAEVLERYHRDELAAIFRAIELYRADQRLDTQKGKIHV